MTRAMHLVIISGRSGSGKSTALHQLEDEGFYCIDNLPAALLPALVDEASRPGFEHFRGAAVCIDARNAWRNLEDFNAIIDALPDSVTSEILFLDAQDRVLIKRFSETRRKHPLSGEQMPLAEAIKRERELLEPIASAAALVLDTSQLTIYELRDAVRQRLIGESSGSMSVLIQSFGFKRGVPTGCRPGVRCTNAAQPPLDERTAPAEWTGHRCAGFPRSTAHDRRAVRQHLRIP